MDIPQIRELIRIVKETGIGEVTVEESGSKVTVRADGTPVYAVSGAPAVAPAAVPAVEATAKVVAPDTPISKDGDVQRPANWLAVTSPMVGTFYAAPGPDKEAFVAIGDEVMAGQTLCIVEAMKLMNEVPAEAMGTIREIVAADGAPVQYGDVLMYLEPVTDQAVNDTVA
jgi:oxaloacetate decarboxylase alpha subunit